MSWVSSAFNAESKYHPTYSRLFQEHKELLLGTSLVAQWLRIRLPMQGTQVRALVQQDPTCHEATKRVRTTTERVRTTTEPAL